MLSSNFEFITLWYPRVWVSSILPTFKSDTNGQTPLVFLFSFSIFLQVNNQQTRGIALIVPNTDLHLHLFSKVQTPKSTTFRKEENKNHTFLFLSHFHNLIGDTNRPRSTRSLLAPRRRTAYKKRAPFDRKLKKRAPSKKHSTMLFLS